MIVDGPFIVSPIKCVGGNRDAMSTNDYNSLSDPLAAYCMRN